MPRKNVTDLIPGDRVQLDTAGTIGTVTRRTTPGPHNTVTVHTDKGDHLTVLPCHVQFD